jgi:hypothetical protein
MGGVLAALGNTIVAFGAIVLVFSDPEKDKSFRSKAVLAGVLIFFSDVTAVCMNVDIWRHYTSWDFRAKGAIISVRHHLATF